MNNKIRMVHLDPKKIKIPKVRVKAVWTDEEYELFKASLDADGQANAVICVKEGETWWLADGQHRLEQALVKGWPRIAVAYKEGTLIDAKLRNLYLNRLRGKTKASEEVVLLKDLYENDGLNLGEIAKRTGLSLETIEKRLIIGKADSFVQEALDHEKIGVGIAFELARLPNPAGQIKLCSRIIAMVPLPSTREVKRWVDGSIELIKAADQKANEPKPKIVTRTLRCQLCDQWWNVRDMIGVNIDRECYGMARQYIRHLLKDVGKELSPSDKIQQEVAEASTKAEGEP